MSRAPAPSLASPRIGRRAAVVGTLSLACGAAPARPVAKAPPPAARYSGKLEDYVPAAGLRWLIQGSPAKLAESQSFRPALDQLISSERLRAVATTTGFALESLPRGVIAGFDLGTLYLAELPAATAAQARERFAARQIRDIAQHSPEPGIAVLTGTNQGVPIGLVTIDERVVAYGVGDPLLYRVVEGYARGKLKAKKAFEGAALRGLERETEGALIAAHVPGPFDERWQNAAAGLLAITTAITAKLIATQAGHARLELSLHGDFSGSSAEERLQSTYMSVASSSTGTLLGLDAALEARTLASPREDVVTLQVPLPITEIARRAHAVTSGDLDEILRLSPASSGIATPTSSPDSR